MEAILYMTPTLADNTPYEHGMDIYDLNGNEKVGQYIAANYTLRQLEAFSVIVGEYTFSYEAGWYLCRNDMEVYSGFEVPLKNYFSTKEAALKAANEQHAASLKARIAQLEGELSRLMI